MSNDSLKRFRAPRALGEERSYSDYVEAANGLAKLKPDDVGLPALRVAILRNITVEPLLPVLAGEVLLAGFYPQFYLGDFDAVHSDVMDPNSRLYSFAPDVILLFQWLNTISPVLTEKFVSAEPAEITVEYERTRRHLRELLTALDKFAAAPVLVNNFPLPTQPTLGILDSQGPAYQTQTTVQLNTDFLSDARALNDVYIVDFMRLFATLGATNCIDERYWHVARAPFSKQALLPIGLEYGKFFRAIRGESKKCLVLDCDNTLWGGIIGEDGMAGIKLGTTYPGSCFTSLQQEIFNLHDRGVILAICSKNNEADVLQVLREHPDMLLKERHFATWQINWQDKVTNLRRIASDLNIGLDSMVLVEDSEFEAEFVRAHLPEVAVIFLPAGAYASYRSRLGKDGYFDSLSFTPEDKRKNPMYREQRERNALQADSRSLDEYLASLEIEVEIGAPSELDIPRIAQLTQKTNQFNLTTRRYTEGDVRRFITSDDHEVFYLKLRDRIADQGLVGAAIMKYEGPIAEIDTFLLSCRVIGRGAEDAFLSVITTKAFQEHGSEKVVGIYRPTDKNGMVEDFYRRHGYSALEDAPGHVAWQISAGNGSLVPSWIRIRNGEPTK